MAVPVLSQVLAQVEDSGWQWGMRFEPAVYAEVTQGPPNEVTLAIARANRCSIQTAYVLKSTSWGLYQLMGFNLWNPLVCAYTHSVGEFLSSEIDQRQCLDRLLDSIRFPDGSADWLMTDDARAAEFARLYNGDAATYLPRLRAAYQALAGQP